jgi:formylglycine-generating enzyme required for sulfatase activity
MVTIPAGSFLRGYPEVETHVPEFQIGKDVVTNEEFDRYMDRYQKTPFAILERKGLNEDVLVAWGSRKSGLNLKGRDSAFLEQGNELAGAVLESSRCLLSPPILVPKWLNHPAYSAYAVFSDWALERGLDPFRLLIGLLRWKEGISQNFEVERVVPDRKRRRKAIEPSFAGPRQPAVQVIWYEAYGFARAVGGRLPTREEWEKVENDWFNEEEGRYRSNRYGLYNMTDYTTEWTARDGPVESPYSLRCHYIYRPADLRKRCHSGDAPDRFRVAATPAPLSDLL